MIGTFRSDLEPEVKITEARILDVIRTVAPTARLLRIGPVDFNPPEWSCWVVTVTDDERDSLAADTELNERLAVVAKAGFPPDSFTFQSDETVSRDYEGSWFYAMR
ncbi:MAG: hypothetical protein J0I47_07405 [Sphingomonas sp.]|uniref:hypothetical protein n=1 Tax=Sphingomonas sp. TaxID=28214 RepID=UPI001AD1E1E7|nr:hypothetical protein [Sphingomonas sp.]MBN8808049.1 hypothetical protein [Sphingomonas sp.]